MVANQKTGRGRPRSFDVDTALATGQRMFHARGYDAVGLAALTDELGIQAPSFYKAFGNKARFFERVLERYAQSVLTLDGLLLPGRAPGDALAELLERAAKTYACDPDGLGCLVLEAARGHDGSESAVLARRVAASRRTMIRNFVAESRPELADVVTDFVASTMSGLSASAREGVSQARLVELASVASLGLRAFLRMR